MNVIIVKHHIMGIAVAMDKFVGPFLLNVHAAPLTLRRKCEWRFPFQNSSSQFWIVARVLLCHF